MSGWKVGRVGVGGAKVMRFISKSVQTERPTGKTSLRPEFQSSGWVFSCSSQAKLPSLLQNNKLPQSFHRGPGSGGPLVLPCRSLRARANPKPPPKENKNMPGSAFCNLNSSRQFVRPILFTAAVGAGSIIACTIWQYEEYRNSLVSGGDGSSASGRFSLSGLRDTVFGTSPSTCPTNSNTTSRRASDHEGDSLQKRVENWWNNMSPGEKVFWPICGLNVLVWLAWRNPSWATRMVANFSSTPVGRKVCLPMLLSTFSHYSFLHLAANMFVLHSFVPAATQILGREQFVAMYLTSGCVAALGSHFHKLFIGNATPSLGASGAIMGILGLVCTRIPDIQLGIIFLPGLQFSADTALKCILAVDTAGVLLGWKFMDHAAHLAGCLFGIAFSHYGGSTFWAFRDYVMTEWHKYRMSGTPS